MKRLGLIGAITGSLVAAVSLASLPALAQSSPTLQMVKAAGTRSLLYLPFYIAVEEGFFAKHGLEVESIVMGNPTPALLSGEIEFSALGADAGVIAAARGKPMPAIATLQQRHSMSLNVSSALSKPDAPYPENVKALKGKLIGLSNRGTGAEIIAKQIFAGAGMEEGRDYDMVVVGNGGTLVTSLKARKIDAALLWPPYGELADVEKIAFPLVRENRDEGPYERRKGVGTAMYVSTEFLKKDPRAVKRFADALSDASAFNRDLDRNREKLVAISAKYTGVENRAVLLDALAMQSTLAYPGIDCDAWVEVARRLIEVKTITAVPKCEDMAALDIASKENGPK